MNCFGCGSSLAGQKYVNANGKPHCLKCFETKVANKCHKCGKVIGVDAKDVVHDEKHFHSECFSCSECGKSLADRAFVRRAGQIACANCEDDGSDPPSCTLCNKVFGPGSRKFTYGGKQWHPECFRCCVCDKPIGQQSFLPRGDGYVCGSCHDTKFANKCTKCGKIINTESVMYKEDPYHPECFACGSCKKALAGTQFAQQDGTPYCSNCFTRLFAKSCARCAKPITGFDGEKFVTFDDKQWHPACFVCAGCEAPMSGKGFVLRDGNVMCGSCAK